MPPNKRGLIGISHLAPSRRSSPAFSADDSDWAAATLKRLAPNAPLALAATIELIRAARADGGIKAALRREYRFAHRVAEQGDFREGIRAAIIDKDKSPAWAHKKLDGATREEVQAMLAPLGTDDLKLEDTP